MLFVKIQKSNHHHHHVNGKNFTSLFYRFNLDKRFEYKCSWKILCIALIFLSIILTILLAYFASKYYIFITNFLLKLSNLSFNCLMRVMKKKKYMFLMDKQISFEILEIIQELIIFLSRCFFSRVFLVFLLMN